MLPCLPRGAQALHAHLRASKRLGGVLQPVTIARSVLATRAADTINRMHTSACVRQQAAATATGSTITAAVAPGLNAVQRTAAVRAVGGINARIVPAHSMEAELTQPNEKRKVEIESQEGEISVAKSHSPKWFDNLPMWARTKRAPVAFKVVMYGAAVPLYGAAIGVHVLPYTIHTELAREMLNWAVHYSAAVLTFNGAIHYGMQLADFGVSKKTQVKGFYNFLRYGFSLVPISLAVMASMQCESFPRDAVYLLMTAFACIGGTDFLFHTFCLTPPWFFRHRLAMVLLLQGAYVLFLLSERMLLRGRNVKLDI
eukprot:GDKI01012159.1.p1 GENE.GDKI01012159.1~~GDKI01012159.1.p1  ORF type:complete len:313 (+),score=47.65 GDKI01012159.1:106-1044(+)